MLGNVLHDETAMAHSSILTEMLPEAGMNVLNGPRRCWGQNRAGSHERSAVGGAVRRRHGVSLVRAASRTAAPRHELERFVPYQQSSDYRVRTARLLVVLAKVVAILCRYGDHIASCVQR
jgi:hypothetical protein